MRADICEVYQAAAGADDSHRTVSIDEMTGIQALERAAPGLPIKPGKFERCERCPVGLLCTAFWCRTSRRSAVTRPRRFDRRKEPATA